MTDPIERPAVYPALAALTGDLTQPTGGSSPPGLGIGTATLLDWDSSTLNGTYDYRGTILQSLPVLSAMDAFSWTAGDEILLLTWHPTDGHRRKGLGSYFVIGRIFRPSAANSEKVLQALQNEFARQVSAEVFAERINFDKVLTGESTTSVTFTNLATVGPQISNVNVEVGAAIISVGCKVNVDLGDVPDLMGGYMGCEVSGSSSVSASTDDSFYHDLHEQLVTGGGTFQLASGTRASYVYALTGLNPGQHTFTAKYRVTNANDTGVTFSDRQMVVIAF